MKELRQTDEVCDKKHGTHILRHFLRHFLEMTVSMIIGMVIFFGIVFQGGLSLIGLSFDEAYLRFPEMVVLLMAVTMILPMIAWMRHRGHGWTASTEMAGSMIVPTFLVISMLWLQVIPYDLMLGLQMILMVPAMILVMLHRRNEYTMPCGSLHHA